MAEPFLSIQHVKKSFGDLTVVQDFNLDAAPGEFVSFLGPSGCGKTTVLRMVAGFEEPTAGRIVIGGKDVTNLKPNQRNIGMVFQAYALFPNLTVAQNIGFGLRVAGMPKADQDKRVAEMLNIIKLPQLGDRYPFQLSGGQQQRVALARSLAKGPKLLLLDEPMGALDKKLRSKMQLELVDIIEKSGVTCVMVTHDQEEAMTMATRIALMDAGRIRQVGTPDEIYESPTSRFAAEFIGSINMFDGRIDEDKADYITIQSPSLLVPIYVGHGVSGYEGQEVGYGVRPEKMVISKDEPEQPYNKARGKIEDIAYFGSHSVFHVRLPSGYKVMANFANQQRWASEGMTWGDEVWVSWGDNEGVVLTS